MEFTISMKYGFFALVMLLGGCVTTHNPIPEGYSGPLITIDDSFKSLGSRKAEMFYIQKINNKDVENAHRKSFSASSGQSGVLVTQGYSHKLPAMKTKLLLSGEIMHGAPIGYLFNSGSNYVVRGEIEFSPEVNKHYLISGELSKERSAVWVENINGDIVSEVVLLVKGNETPSITPASIFIEESDHAAHSLSDVKEDKITLFSNISGGESLTLVITKVGEPDSISYDDGNFFSQRRPHIDYIYSGLGKIRFTSRNKKAENVLRVFPSIADDSGLLTAHLESSGMTLQHIAKEYYKRDALSEEELDKVATAIWSNRNTEDSYTADGVAWLIKVIGKQGNSRYYSLINALNDKDKYSRKIVGYANKILKNLEPSNINQFSLNG